MSICEPPNSSTAYGRRLWSSGLQGARSGEHQFLHGERLAPYLNHSARSAVAPAMVGACLGVVGGFASDRRTSTARALACGLMGGLMGFTVGLAWESRSLTRCVVSGMRRNIDRVRDEHWLEHHPIDYA